MSYPVYIILFFFGLAVGSFLNVVSLRYKPERNVFSPDILGGRSHCPHCKKTLRWFELIPLISFILERGRCLSCDKKISIQYPLIEALSGIIFVTVPFYLQYFYGIKNLFYLGQPLWSFYGLATVWIVVFLVWLLMTLIDMRLYIIPNELNLSLGILGVLIIFIKSFASSWLQPFHSSFIEQYELLFSPFQQIWTNHLFGAVLSSLFFYTLYKFSKGRAMGGGDVKLALASGLVLGWPDIGLSLALAFIFGGIFGVVLLLNRKKTMKDKLPFAPIFILGMVVTIFFGTHIISGYFRLFNI